LWADIPRIDIPVIFGEALCKLGCLDCLGSASPYSSNADEPHPALVVASLLKERGTGRHGLAPNSRRSFQPEPISGLPVMGFLLSAVNTKEEA
jgi:hypothetical protein